MPTFERMLQVLNARANIVAKALPHLDGPSQKNCSQEPSSQLNSKGELMARLSGTLHWSFVRRFDRASEDSRDSAKSRRRRVAMRRLAVGEQLEQRAVFAVDSFSTAAGGAISSGWVSIVASEGDDVYISQISPAAVGSSAYSPSLLYANNASFLGAGEIPNINGIDEVLISSATVVRGTASNNLLTSSTYPFLTNGDGSASRQTVFSLRSRVREFREPVSGEILNGVGGKWSFTQDRNGVFSITPIAALGPAPVSMFLQTGTYNLFGDAPGSLGFTWDTNFVGIGGLSATSPPTLNVAFNSGSFGYSELRGLVASVPSRARFNLPAPDGVLDGEAFVISPGTLRGTVSSADGEFSVDFSPTGPQSSTLAFLYNGQYSDDMYFNDGSTSGRMYDGRLVYDANGRPAIEVSFENGRFIGGDWYSLGARSTGPVNIVADYAVATKAGAAKEAVSDANFVAGLDFNRKLSINMSDAGATIRINSPLVKLPSLDMRASNIRLDAPISSQTSVTIGAASSGASCEQIFFNAAIEAQAFDLRVADDPNTGAVTRSKIFVSPSGSLGGGGVANAQTLFAQVIGGDIFIEGTISAETQSWLMQSAEPLSDDVVPDQPYIMSTTAVVSGASTGLIKGRSVAILLANDLPSLYDNTDIGGSTALSEITLETDVDSLRITAADRKGNPLATAFPNDVQIREGFRGGDGNINIDAVASSSRTLEFQARNNITFNASLATEADVIVFSGEGQITMKAPLSTAFGSIELSANSLTIGNSVRVLDTRFEETAIDVILEARNGDMILNGPISAVNSILLSQSGKGNVIRGPSRLIADGLVIKAEGSAELITSVREVSGSVGGGIAITEADSLVISDLSAGDRRVSVTVGGEDYYFPNFDGTPDMDSGKQSALKANLSDVNELIVSAPLGSIEVFVDSTKDIVLGNIAAIQARTATSMTAAGSVSIRTSAAGIVAYDAPVAGASARQVSVASTGNLAGTFLSRQPGVYSATLTGLGSLTALNLALDGISDLRVGDLLLLKDQTAGKENGVYRVVSVGSTATSGQWTLARTSDLDTSAEAKLNTWIRPLRGGTQAQKLFAIKSFGDDGDKDALARTPRRVTAVTNVGLSFAVKAVSSAALPAQYTVEDDVVSGLKIRTLTGSSEGAIPLFDGVRVTTGDIVLVRQGHISDSGPSTTSIGVYEVVAEGDSTAAWTLRSINDFQIGRIVANEGSLRASKTGQALEVAYDNLNNATMTIEAVADSNVTQKIGSGDSNDTVRFVVSTNLGTNNSLGSLGKMLLLVQADPVLVENPELAGEMLPQTQTIAFASTLGGTVVLTQALPAIRKRLVLDASTGRVGVPGGGPPAIVLDGSRISSASDSTPVGPTGAADGLQFIGEKASGSILNGIVLGGFGKGSAVVVDGASDLLISNLKIGENAAGVKLGNKYGIRVVNGSGGFTTLLNNSIKATTLSAIQVAETKAGNADNAVRIVGNIIGGATAGNGTGIDLIGGNNLVGTAAIDVTLKRLSVTKVKDSATQFLLPAGFAQLAQLRIGLGLQSSRITAPDGSPAATIKSISAPDALKVVTVEIDGTIVGAGLSLVLDVGIFVQPQEDDASKFKLPAGVDISDVFLGQSISGSNVSAGTIITAIKTDIDGHTLTFSRPLLRTDATAVVFGAGGRNQLSFNNYGIVQRAGTSRIYNTTVGASVFDGIKIDGGEAIIGLGSTKNIGAGGRSPSKDRNSSSSNFVYGSGLAGIRVAQAPASIKIEIQGNYLGVTSSGAASTNKSGNIIGSSLVNQVRTGSVKTASTDGRLLTITLTNHGLSDGNFVWLKIGANTVGNSYRVLSRTNVNTFTAALAGVASVLPKPEIDNAVAVQVYGVKTESGQLAGTEGVDFEGNQHGLQVAPPTVGTGTSPTTGNSGKPTGGVSAGRPIVKPVRRPVRR